MKLYRTIFLDDQDHVALTHESWTGTLADASKERKRLKLEGMRNIVTDEVEVPTHKVNLLAWLNARPS